jgi:hypothetical protein
MTAAELEPIGVAPMVAFGLVGCGVTKGYELIALRELEAYKIGRATRVTMASIRAYVARRLAYAQSQKGGLDAP